MSLPVSGEEKTELMSPYGQPGVAPLLPAPPPGTRIADKYVVERVIGVGGMAVVVAARHVHLEQRVAIKLLLPDHARDAQTVARFLREGQVAARIRSEHVVRVHDVGMLDGQRPYMVLELLEGRDLGEIVAAGRLPVPLAVDYVLQASEAVAEAHALGIVHRDLKPSNLFLNRGPDGAESVKVLDFGISKVADGGAVGDAKLTKTGALLGTPAYMAPEQLRGRDVDPRTDVWGLGSILYELCSGACPFGGETMTALAAAILTDAPPQLRYLRPDAPAELDAVIERCLHKRPEDRYPSLAEMAAALAPLGTPAARTSLERIARVLAPRSDANTPSLEGSVRLTTATTLSERRPPSRLRWVAAVAALVALTAVGTFVTLRGTDRRVAASAPADPPASAPAPLDPPAPPAPSAQVAAPPAAPPANAAPPSATVATTAAPTPVKARPGPGGKRPFITTDRGK
jgi:serine/threonine-protein kinase